MEHSILTVKHAIFVVTPNYQQMIKLSCFLKPPHTVEMEVKVSLVDVKDDYTECNTFMSKDSLVKKLVLLTLFKF